MKPKISALFVAAGLLLCSVFGSARKARAEPRSMAEPAPQPPPISSHYLQYGVGLTGQSVMSAGRVCDPGSEVPCILGSGGGLAIRAGYRARTPWYLGGAYEFSRQDSADLMPLAILQQLRAEFRYHFLRARRISPYFQGEAGALLYGNEWSAETWGVAAALGGGLQLQVTPEIGMHLCLSYRSLMLRRWTDGTGQVRGATPLGFGVAQMIGIDIGFSIQEPLARW